MKFLVAEITVDTDKRIVAGEPVIPSFHPPNTFLGATSGATCMSAKLKTGPDPDLVRAALADLFPGIPEELIAFYVVRTAVAVNKYTPSSPEDVYRIFCDDTKAILQNVRTQELIPLWEGFDSTKYL